VAISTAYAVRL